MHARPTSRMTRGARAIALVAALLLGMLYVTPLWSVRLVAPQYPEGLGMHIRLHTVEGAKEHDLRNINSLNRYIGMKPIQPDAIPELEYLPWIVAGLIGAGLLVAAAGRRRLLLVWVVAFVGLGAAGLYDFHRWGHDYGHNLDVEHAIIVVPGMTYQPPVIGTKQLLNFTATSLPAAGGIIAGVSLLLAVAALVLSYRRTGGRAASVGAALIAAACATDSPRLALGVACVECRMLVSDGRFGAVVLTKAGKTLAFDSLECLLEYLRAHPGLERRGTWVVDAGAPLRLVPAEQAVFVRDGALHPPMGSIVSFASTEEARRLGDGPIALSWRQLEELGVAHAR